MKIAVSGGAGFIGSHIVDRMIELGHSVVVIDDLSRGKRVNINGRAGFYKTDIAAPKAKEVIALTRPQVLIHHAAQMDVRVSVADPLFDARVNVLGSLNLLEACLAARCKKVIFASTGGAIYGDSETIPTVEEAPKAPVSPYGVAKLAVEHYLHYYHVQYGLSYVSLRYANVYGPRQDPFGEAGVVAIFATKLLQGETAVINGDGKQTRDYVYVDDVVEANVAALELKGETAINIGTGLETDVNTLYGHMKKAASMKLSAKHGPAKPGEQLRSCLSWDRANRILGWSPQMELKEGLKRTVDYFRK